MLGLCLALAIYVVHAASQHSFHQEVKNISDLRCDGVAMNEGLAAACAVVRHRGVMDRLQISEQRVHYIGWNVSARWAAARKLWEVEIVSSGTMLPRYRCQASVNSIGDLVPVEDELFSCRYLK